MELTRALLARSVAENQIAEILRRDYPPGTKLSWEMGGMVKHGLVVVNGYGDRIKVHNTSTRREYWIYAYRITGASS